MTSKFKTFSFGETEDKDILDYLALLKKQHVNISKYIAKLIREDIKEESLETRVRKIVDNYLAARQVEPDNITEALKSIFD
jgi:hypothetical protein